MNSPGYRRSRFRLKKWQKGGGRQRVVEPGKKIVQQWYFGDQPEASIVTIKLHEHGQSTSVELRHSNVPDEDYDDIVEGWNNAYFGALREFYE